MPGGPIQAPIWTEQDRDTGCSLKCIVDTLAAGATPTEDGHIAWLNRDGFNLFQRTGTKKCNNEELPIANISIPAQNAISQNVFPGGDSHRAIAIAAGAGANSGAVPDQADILVQDQADILGRDQGRATPLPPEINLPRSRVNDNLGKLDCSGDIIPPGEGIWNSTAKVNNGITMSIRQGLIVVPQMPKEGYTRTLCLLFVDTPAGVRKSTVDFLMGDNCCTAAGVFTEVSEAYDANCICDGMHDSIKNAMVIALADHEADECAFIRRDGNIISADVKYQLPNRAENQFIHPITGSSADYVNEKVLPGGRRIYSTCCWEASDDPIHAPLQQTTLGSNEQELRSQLARAPAESSSNNNSQQQVERGFLRASTSALNIFKSMSSDELNRLTPIEFAGLLANFANEN